MRVELGVGDLARSGIEQPCVADGVDGEAPQVVPQVAPGVEIPVVAVVHQALRRDGALGLLVFLAVVVPDPELRALEHCLRGDAEVLGVAGAALGLEDADAALDFLPGVVARAEELAQALSQRVDLPVEHARLQIAEHAQRGKQRQHLGCVEPEARQLVTRPGARRGVAVAVRLAVVLDRRVEALAHVGEVALDARRRHAELALEHGERHHPALGQQPVDLVEALEAVHRPDKKIGTVPIFAYPVVDLRCYSVGSSLPWPGLPPCGLPPGMRSIGSARRSSPLNSSSGLRRRRSLPSQFWAGFCSSRSISSMAVLSPCPAGWLPSRTPGARPRPCQCRTTPGCGRPAGRACRRPGRADRRSACPTAPSSCPWPASSYLRCDPSSCALLMSWMKPAQGGVQVASPRRWIATGPFGYRGEIGA